MVPSLRPLSLEVPDIVFQPGRNCVTVGRRATNSPIGRGCCVSVVSIKSDIDQADLLIHLATQVLQLIATPLGVQIGLGVQGLLRVQPIA